MIRLAFVELLLLPSGVWPNCGSGGKGPDAIAEVGSEVDSSSVQMDALAPL